ncbi:hypothetical protein BS78_01G413900 [Paspalum vaginatum]|nr:hypothetical protein BS78_01G413900 [Paspalum vaginatum]
MEFESEDAARVSTAHMQERDFMKPVLVVALILNKNSKNGHALDLVLSNGWLPSSQRTISMGPVPPRKLGSRPANQKFDPMEKPHSIEVVPVDQPFEGMEFELEEAAKLFYVNYGRLNGFCAHISRYCCSSCDNSTVSCQIVCSKEGFREVRTKKVMTDEGKTKCPRMITRVGCTAMIVKEHNHSLSYSRAAPSTSNIVSGELADFTAKSVGPNNEIKIEGHNAGAQCRTTDSLTVLYNNLCQEAIKFAKEEKVAEVKRSFLTLPHCGFISENKHDVLQAKTMLCNVQIRLYNCVNNVPPSSGFPTNARQGRHATEGSIMHVDNIKETSLQKPQNTNYNQAIHGKDEGIHGSSEETMVDIPAIPLATCMPVIQNLPGSSADGPYRLLASPIEAVPIPYRPAESIRQPQRGVCALGPFAGVLSELNNRGTGPNSLVHATALSGGAIIPKVPSSNLTSPVPPAIAMISSSEDENDHSEPLMVDVGRNSNYQSSDEMRLQS